MNFQHQYGLVMTKAPAVSWWLCFVVVFSCGWSAVSICDAQILRLDAEQKAPAAAAAPEVQRLEISSAAEPSPALRYRLWVPDIRRRDGNAITNFLRANALVREVSNRQQIDQQWSDKWLKYAGNATIEKFPKAEAAKYLDSYQSVLKELAELDSTSRIEYDHTWSERKGVEVYSVLFPEIQQARHLALLLQVQSRLATAEGRFDDAISSIRVGMRLSEVVSHMGRSFLIGKLVSFAIAQEMLGEIETLIQQPGAPNLYWAIASWPSELGNLQDATEGEMVALQKLLYRIMELPNESITDAAWRQRVIDTTADMLQMMDVTRLADPRSQKASDQIIAGCVLILFGDRAHSAIAVGGQDSTSTMSYSEALVRCTRQDLLQHSDNFFKWSLLGEDGLDRRERIDDFLVQVRNDEDSPAGIVLSSVLPSLYWVGDHHRRMINNRNRLMTIEALRAYAAEHQHQLPEKLDDLQPLPAWKSAIHGREFEYSRSTPTQAVLSYESPWSADERSKTEITLRP